MLLLALQSLSSSFALPVDFLQKNLIAHKIVNWTNIEHIAGGYSYNFIGSAEAKKILQHPVDETIFFAGEAIYEGISEGTVEAALVSGKQAALKIATLPQ